jgi:hypothetical protein
MGDAAVGLAVDADQVAPDRIDVHGGGANALVEQVGHQQPLGRLG